MRSTVSHQQFSSASKVDAASKIDAISRASKHEVASRVSTAFGRNRRHTTKEGGAVTEQNTIDKRGQDALSVITQERLKKFNEI
jgi:hypothetical protein